MADSAASTQSRPRESASKKRREATVSPETENKLARAARSAQRLAQLSGAAGDDSTLDMFPDDPTRATLEAMSIDIRQGTLHGFELPDAVLAAVGVMDAGDGVSSDARTATRRMPRGAARGEEPVLVNPQLSGLDIEPWLATGGASGAGGLAEPQLTVRRAEDVGSLRAAPVGESVGEAVAGGAVAAEGRNAGSLAADLAGNLAVKQQPADESAKTATSARDLTSAPAMAATTAVRSKTTLSRAPEVTGAAPVSVREIAAASSGGDTAALGGSAAAPVAAAGAGGGAGVAAARGGASNESAAARALADAGSTQAEAARGEARAASASAALGASGASRALDVSSVLGASDASGVSGVSGAAAAPAQRAFTPPRKELHRSEAVAPELDLARATAFADTVDALYGVIADQRRAATDHSRRMKWMLSIVVAALLVTVAIGIAQTLLLMRLTRETTAQQHRVEQLMQNQQAAMTSLIDTHVAMAEKANAVDSTNAVNMANAAGAAASLSAARPSSAAAPQHPAPPPVHAHHSVRTQHAHRAKKGTAG